jgi:hypothetical protein
MAFGDVGEHQDKATIRVPSKAIVTSEFRELFDDDVIETEVEDGIHHAWHRLSGARTDGDEKWHNAIFDTAEGFVVVLLNVMDVSHNVVPHVIWDLLARFVVESASIGSDGETGWDWNTSGGHLGKTEAFSTKDVLANFGFVGFLEGVYILLFCHFVLLIDKS